MIPSGINMTPKAIAHDIIEQENVFLAQAYQLAQAYLQLESRIQKLEAVVARVNEMYMKLSPSQREEWTPYWLEKYDRIGEAIAELER